MLVKTFFVSDEIHPKEVTLADGSKHTLHFRELPAGAFRRYALDNESDDEQVRVDSMARLIAAALVDENGKPGITFEQAKRLKPQPMIAIFNAIQEVNITRPKKATNGDSGTS